jgi:uncharacterized low-complexity protein
MKMKIAILAACAGAVVFAATTCAYAETKGKPATFPRQGTTERAQQIKHSRNQHQVGLKRRGGRALEPCGRGAWPCQRLINVPPE